MRIRHHRRPKGPHGGRALAVREAAWSKVCDATFAFMDWLPGIDLTLASGSEPPRLPQIADEEEFLDALGGLATEILKPQDFGIAWSDEEMLAWLEASLNGGLH
jgi:hypothetical protein